MFRLRALSSLALLSLLLPMKGRADAIYFDLAAGPLLQDWSNVNLISGADNWAGVPSMIGYRGDDLASTGTSPATIVAPGTNTPVDVLANQSNTSSSTGGVAEFDGIANPTIALQGSGTASAPFLLFHLNALQVDSLHVSYRLRDLDGSADNAIQSVALQYRIGSTGDFTNLADAFVADATAGPGLSGLVTPVIIILPSLLAGTAELQLRIITADALRSDEWVGIDDIAITGIRRTESVPDTLPVVFAALPLIGMMAAARRARSFRA